MKVVINKCYGGFNLSPIAIKFFAEKQKRPCYFFESMEMKPISLEKAQEELLWFAFDIPDADNIFTRETRSSNKKDSNDLFRKHEIVDSITISRTDPTLIEAVETFGAKASGMYAKLEIVEIPDDVDYEIEEYDGFEWISEKHRRWE